MVFVQTATLKMHYPELHTADAVKLGELSTTAKHGKSAKRNDHLSIVNSIKIYTGKEKNPDCVPDAGRIFRKPENQNAPGAFARMQLSTNGLQKAKACKAGMIG